MRSPNSIKREATWTVGMCVLVVLAGMFISAVALIAWPGVLVALLLFGLYKTLLKTRRL